MRRWVFLAASLLVSAGFLWLAVQGVPLADVADGIRQARFGWVVVSFVCILGAQATRSLRWRALLDNRVKPLHAFHILNVMMMLNQLPLRAGEVARVLLVTRSGVPVVTAATSIVVERLIDVVTVVVILAFSVSRLPDAPATITQIAALFGAAAVIAFVALVTFARYPQVAHRALVWLETRLPVLARLKLRRRVDEVLDGLRPITQPRKAAQTLGWTAAGWSFSMATFYSLEQALDVTGVDLVLGSLIGVSLAAFSLAIPVSVAAIGPFEGAVRVAGDAVGMNAVTATTLGFLFHGITVISYAIIGVIGLLALGVSLGDVLNRKPNQPISAAVNDSNDVTHYSETTT